MRLGVGFVGASSLTAYLGADALAAEPSKAGSNPGTTSAPLTPDQALAELTDGNQRFVNSKRKEPHQEFVRVSQVAKGQAPFAAILSCADSRVVPEILFDQGIGDLFVVRVAGNTADPNGIASEEYAVAALGVSLLLVLGHERCGAVDAAVKGGALPGVIGNLIYEISPAVELVRGKPGDFLANAVQANVMMQVKKLQNSPIIAERVQQGKLKVAGGYYDLDTGVVKLLNA